MAPSAASRPADLTGPQKVAILCMTLGAKTSSQILSHLTPEELEAISFEIARAGEIGPEMARQVLSEWERGEPSSPVGSGGIDYARRVLNETLSPDKAAAVVERVERKLETAGHFTKLKTADGRGIATALRGEHPQTMALVLSQLDPEQTAEVLDELDPAVSAEVLYRMATLGPVSGETLELVERALDAESELESVKELRVPGGPGAAAAVLKKLSGEKEQELLGKVAEHDPELSEKIKNLTFVFEDLISLDDRSLQRLLREVDTGDLALALKAASEPLSEKLRGNMTQRAVAALDEAIDFLGPVRVSEVEGAQGKILAEVQRLEAAGELVLGVGDDDPLV